MGFSLGYGEGAEVPALAAIGITPEVGVLAIEVSREGDRPPPPAKGPSLFSKAWVEGDRGAAR